MDDGLKWEVEDFRARLHFMTTRTPWPSAAGSKFCLAVRQPAEAEGGVGLRIIGLGAVQSRLTSPHEETISSVRPSIADGRLRQQHLPVTEAPETEKSSSYGEDMAIKKKMKFTVISESIYLEIKKSEYPETTMLERS